MLSFLIKFLFFHISGKSRNKAVLFGSELLSLFLTLYVFSMGSKLVDREMVAQESENLFQFLLIGELALILPISFFENIIRNFQDFFYSQFLDTLRGNQINSFILIVQKSLAELLFPIVRIALMLILSLVVFGETFPFLSLLRFAFVQILALISMGMVGLLVIQFFENYQRGLKAIYTLNSLLAVIGGAYFPIRFLPSYVKDYIVWIFPQTIILQLSRVSFLKSFSEMTYYGIYFVFYLGVMGIGVKCIVRYLNKKNLSRIFGHIRFS